ncbi:MAG: alpha/beta hydrolase [Candidatus Merdivicinus sp.]|jgi:acetyl esterase/lipase
MIFKEWKLEIDYAALGLKKPEKNPEFSGIILKNYAEYSTYKEGERRPAVLVLPGGGYAFTSRREATPIVLEFAAAGFSTFLLHYSVAPDVEFPTELVQAYTAIRMIRQHADEWGIDPEKIYVCGFSAGGHLTASTGVFWNRDWIHKLGFEGDAHKPNGLILCYPVISGGEFAHRGSYQNLLGKQYSEDLVELNSLEKQVSSDTPPCFLWHTYTDQAVPVQNTLLFANELAKYQIPFEMHVYPSGNHGLSLANELVCGTEGILPKVQTWIHFATEWIKGR